ncbi:MAG TPA: acyl carrier protein [Longimicrobiaceae bacterium]|nr:acyl carrier protein [Longimicrobiaceae bacterium]
MSPVQERTPVAEITPFILQTIARISIPPRDPSEVRPTDSLERDLNVDSLGFIELVIEIENTFGMQFEDDYVFVQAHPSVQALIDYVAEVRASVGHPS